MTEVTIGIDIGTTSVKAIAADGDGGVVAAARVPHPLRIDGPEELAHDIDAAWCDGVRDAYLQVSGNVDVVGVNVAAMVPSLGALTAAGRGAGPGLLYGDHRGRRAGNAPGPVERGEMVAFLGWLRANCPDAERFWPAQATANHTLCGRAAMDTTTAFTAHPLFDGATWDESIAAEVDVTTDQLPDIVVGMDAVGRVGGDDGPLLGGGTIDAMAEQVVAGADNDGDVLVICGTTLITWAVMKGDEWLEQPGLWTIPHTAPGKLVIGGPSNAGGLFLNWARRLAGVHDDEVAPVDDPSNVPVWLPYVRGERTPLHRNDLRASLHGLNLTHTSAHVARAAYEAAGFVVRHHLDLAGDLIAPQRLVATGGGARVQPWVQALADCTQLPVDVVAVPEGGALGSAFIARCVAGLDAQMSDGARWARFGRRVEPDETWSAAADERYAQFRALTDAAVGSGGES